MLCVVTGRQAVRRSGGAGLQSGRPWARSTSIPPCLRRPLPKQLGCNVNTVSASRRWKFGAALWPAVRPPTRSRLAGGPGRVGRTVGRPAYKHALIPAADLATDQPSGYGTARALFDDWCGADWMQPVGEKWFKVERNANTLYNGYFVLNDNDGNT